MTRHIAIVLGGIVGIIAVVLFLAIVFIGPILDSDQFNPPPENKEVHKVTLDSLNLCNGHIEGAFTEDSRKVTCPKCRRILNGR